MIDIKPRFKIQYPMKNHDKSNGDLHMFQYSKERNYAFNKIIINKSNTVTMENYH